MTIEIGTKIHWNGDCANDPRDGNVIGINGDMVTIEWVSGGKTVQPAALLQNKAWSIVASGTSEADEAVEPEDNYWLDCIRLSSSNSCVAGWSDIRDFIASDRIDDKALMGFHAALRALSQQAQQKLSLRREARKGTCR